MEYQERERASDGDRRPSIHLPDPPPLPPRLAVDPSPAAEVVHPRRGTRRCAIFFVAAPHRWVPKGRRAPWTTETPARVALAAASRVPTRAVAPAGGTTRARGAPVGGCYSRVCAPRGARPCGGGSVRCRSRTVSMGTASYVLRATAAMPFVFDGRELLRLGLSQGMKQRRGFFHAKGEIGIRMQSKNFGRVNFGNRHVRCSREYDT
mmetsp:Transcript_37891/g.74188  ORF Transcript_37891/g.74188 Transcript_37891/m.74188 type:complete len:207 (-) Transcript_37891:614-1234(-)